MKEGRGKIKKIREKYRRSKEDPYIYTVRGERKVPISMIFLSLLSP